MAEKSFAAGIEPSDSRAPEESKAQSKASTSFVVPKATLPKLDLAIQEGVGVSYRLTAAFDATKPFATAENVETEAASLDISPAAAAPIPAAAEEQDFSAQQAAPTEATPQISTEQVTEEQVIPFETVYQHTEELFEGEQEIAQTGSNGLVRVVYEQSYTDGVLMATNEISRETVLEAVDQIILVGTASLPVVEEPQSMTPAAASDLGFSSPGSTAAAVNNYAIIASLLNYNGALTYSSFNDNGDGTITVDGVTFAVSSGPTSYFTTYYDGYECAKVTDFQYAVTAPNGYMCNKTASGILAARGVISTSQSGGLPFGTVVFIEGYGLGVVGDYGGFGAGMLDMSLDAGEIESGISLSSINRNVYIISTP
ncbi:MAG: G5 domain-containing protein [Eubacteriales bacterium]|nr:G5 domain-containing protein [Eubacteriales bacterium]